VRQIHVRYSYNDRVDSDPLIGGGNTLDIGLFDERGIASGSPGFRGWSGSEKLELTVDAEWATPPYRGGPIGAGVWHVVLGAYKVMPRGLGYRIEITFNAGLSRERRVVVRSGPPRRPPVATAAEPGWVRGDLHCHTLFSDGDSWPAEMLHAAAEAGLDFLGVTDHNTVAHHAEYGAGGGAVPVVVPGIEVTTYHGHWNAWGTERWYDFREATSGGVSSAVREAIACSFAVSRGNIRSTPHPRRATRVDTVAHGRGAEPRRVTAPIAANGRHTGAHARSRAGQVTTSASAHATPSAMSARSSMPSIAIPASVRYCGSDPGRTGDPRYTEGRHGCRMKSLFAPPVCGLALTAAPTAS